MAGFHYCHYGPIWQATYPAFGDFRIKNFDLNIFRATPIRFGLYCGET